MDCVHAQILRWVHESERGRIFVSDLCDRVDVQMQDDWHWFHIDGWPLREWLLSLITLTPTPKNTQIRLSRIGLGRMLGYFRIFDLWVLKDEKPTKKELKVLRDHKLLTRGGYPTREARVIMKERRKSIPDYICDDLYWKAMEVDET